MLSSSDAKYAIRLDVSECKFFDEKVCLWLIVNKTFYYKPSQPSIKVRPAVRFKEGLVVNCLKESLFLHEKVIFL